MICGFGLAADSGVVPQSIRIQHQCQLLRHSPIAPSEADEAGAVSLEFRSKRGVAKAAITFDTNASHNYLVRAGERRGCDGRHGDREDRALADH